jgi:branched-chain amino acid transport system substrate-binding protein
MSEGSKGVSRRTVIKGRLAGAATTGIAGFPFISYGQSDVISIGHLTPRTGFLGRWASSPCRRRTWPVAEINAAGGVNGRKIELLKEDSVNPQTASTKAERMIERDKVACIIGEISSASALTIGQVAERTKTLFINTGANSDQLRGKSCNKYMFHIESQNSMYVKTCGRSLMAQGLVKGKKWFSLTADYAFGHDLLAVAKKFMSANGGEFAADKLVPTDATDFSPLLLEIRNAKPDLVSPTSPATRSPTSSSSTPSSACPFPTAGFGFDTAVAWAAGKGNFSGTWPLVWHHLIDTPASKKFVADFTARYKRPPENQAWGDYNAMKLSAPGDGGDQVDRVDQARRALREEQVPALKTRDGTSARPTTR